jgi:hypothetical protein
MVVAPGVAGQLDLPLDNGWFFKQANGFGGAGDSGFSVVDDASASFWSEFQRLGGVDKLGFPISKRFQYGGFLTQAFQRMALQWRPDLGQAVPVNIMDDLAARGANSWLERTRQVPVAIDSAGEANLEWEDVVARHVGLLTDYPALRQFYEAEPEAMTLYGLPLGVAQYGPVISVRLQRATLQLWTTDVPWAAAGTVAIGNAGDLAKEVGLWPASAVAPVAQGTSATRSSVTDIGGKTTE